MEGVVTMTVLTTQLFSCQGPEQSLQVVTEGGDVDSAGVLRQDGGVLLHLGGKAELLHSLEEFDGAATDVDVARLLT